MDLPKALSMWLELQETVIALMDASKVSNNSSKDAQSGIRQLLEKKEGLFRMNMMGNQSPSHGRNQGSHPFPPLLLA